MKGIKYLFIVLIVIGLLLNGCETMSPDSIGEDIISEIDFEEEQELIIDNFFDNYSEKTKNLKLTVKEWNGWKVINRYTDENGNLIRYRIDENNLTTDYYFDGEVILIKTKQKDGEEYERVEWWVQEGNSIFSIDTIKEENLTILTTKEVDFLYEKLLDGQEQKNFSDTVALKEKIVFNFFEDYKRYLTYQSEEFINGVYIYEADGINITLEQALDLCAEAVAKQTPNLVMDRVMEKEGDRYVGYRLNHREFGDGVIENKIGTLGANTFDGMAYNIYMYEEIIDNLETKEGHIAITSEFHIFLRDRLLVIEG